MIFSHVGFNSAGILGLDCTEIHYYLETSTCHSEKDKGGVDQHLNHIPPHKYLSYCTAVLYSILKISFYQRPRPQ